MGFAIVFGAFGMLVMRPYGQFFGQFVGGGLGAVGGLTMHREDQSLPFQRILVIFGGTFAGCVAAWIAVPSDAELGIVTCSVLASVGATAAAFLSEPLLRSFFFGFLESLLEAIGVYSPPPLKVTRSELGSGAVAIGAAGQGPDTPAEV